MREEEEGTGRRLSRSGAGSFGSRGFGGMMLKPDIRGGKAGEEEETVMKE